MDTTKQLELAVVFLQEQRNTALDTIINLKIEIAALNQRYQDVEMEINRFKLEAAAKTKPQDMTDEQHKKK